MSRQEIMVEHELENINIKPYRHHTKYYETDQMGIIHHSNYVKWMEDARMNLMKQMGLSYQQMEQMEIICPVLSININYIGMVHFDETVIIETQVSNYDGFHMEIEYKMYNEENKALYATAYSKHCFLNKSGKPISLKRIYPELDTKFYEMKDE